MDSAPEISGYLTASGAPAFDLAARHLGIPMEADHVIRHSAAGEVRIGKRQSVRAGKINAGRRHVVKFLLLPLLRHRQEEIGEP